MTKSIWVDGAAAKRGVAVLALGLSLLAATLGLGGRDSSTPGCGSLSDPEQARECVSSSAQAIDRGSLAVIGVVVLAMAVAAVGGILVARSRHRVMDITEAAPLLETDVPGVRSLISNGALVSFTAHGRTYVEDAMVQRTIQKHADRGALPESV